jgi:16S rRNA (uracil1498-N3)-methyltransferase
LDRLRRVVLEAAKQSLNPWLPHLAEEDFATVVGRPWGRKYIARQGANISLQSACTNPGDIIVLIGPEGDFTESETTLALEKGFMDVHLGRHRLRTETAALVACHTITLMHD